MRALIVGAVLLAATPALAASTDDLNRIARIGIFSIYSKQCVPKGNPPLPPEHQKILDEGLAVEDPADIAEMESFLASAVGVEKLCKDFAYGLTHPDEEE